jgi:uncharacterized membrane protein HdeD (DUF308 family)
MTSPHDHKDVIMSFVIQSRQPDLLAFSKYWLWFVLFGIALIILGLIAISDAAYATLVSVVLLGILLFIGGVIEIIDTLSFWRKTSGFFLHLLIGILYVIAGIALIENPILASVSITLFLGIFYIILGLSRLFYSITVRMPMWGWYFLTGLIALLLGILILAKLPVSSLLIIGLFVGIELVFSGWAYLMMGIAAKRMGS